MLTFLSLSGFCYLLYLYKYDHTKLNNIYNCLPNFRTVNNENNRDNHDNRDIEIGISDDYDMTDHPPNKDNPVDYYDNSFSTEFVESLPNFHRFYSFTKKNDDHNTQNV
tara:strand:+ start:593 stop:919 length:327 start_codon:yes stop_codon:yes gene_type:complete